MKTPRASLACVLASAVLCAGCAEPTAGALPGAAGPPTAGAGAPAASGRALTGTTPGSASAATGGGRVAVTLGLPYKADVQFTPLYVAQADGIFDSHGLDVTLQYGNESQFVRLVGSGDMDATIASGEQVILARAAQIPVKYVATWYQRFAGVVFSLQPKLNTPQSLVGHRVGLPALSGASYIGWQALLASSGVDPEAVTTEVVGYEQLPAVVSGRVEAAVGYAANEPVQLRADGQDVTVVDIADYFNLVSNGLVVSDPLIADRSDVVGALVASLLEGIASTLGDPDRAFETALRFVPEAADPSVRDRQRAVLIASLPYWSSPSTAGQPLGAISAESWSQSQTFLVSIGLLERESPVTDLIDDQFVKAADLRAPAWPTSTRP